MIRYLLSPILGLLVVSSSSADDSTKPVRLFILSGQSNMAGLNPDVSFTPAVKAAFPDDEVIVVKSAQGGQPIRRWFKKWEAPEGTKVANFKPGDLYDTLMAAVTKAIGAKKPTTVTFVWMQGERDAREKLDGVYQASLKGLVEQLRQDLGREDVSVVVGRLSDHGNQQESWLAVRKAQEQYAESDPRAAWVDTDDLNGPKDGLHYDKAGYAELGKRFAAKAIEFQQTKSKSTGR